MKIKPISSVFIVCTLLTVSSFIYTSNLAHNSLKDLTFQIDTLATNLRVPWQIAFLPDRSMLFTERPGRLRVFRNDKLIERPIFTVADVKTDGKTGLLGLAVHPEFSANHFIYLANNYMNDNSMRLRITRYILANDTLTNAKVILENIPANRNHTGCRLIFGPDKKLYVTTGDADQPMLAQDLKAYNGKILRLNDDGTIPLDNPFIKNDTARKEIWSYGHRNTQGLAFQPLTNVLFNSEHGPTGGDELNIIVAGANYGWPVIHHRETKNGMVSPLLEYTPSIGPSEAVFYNHAAFPELKGNLLVACLRGEEILRIQLDKQKVIGQEVLFKNTFGRIRSLVIGPDGYIYLSTSNYDPPEGHGSPPSDLLLRIRPGKGALKKISYQTSIPAAKKTAQNIKSKTIKNGRSLIFQQMCASCHSNIAGRQASATDFSKGKFNYGADKKSIIKNITIGIPEKGMPSWKGAISSLEIEKLANYIRTLQRKH